MTAERDMMENDAADLTDVDRLVIAIVSNSDIRRTRLQKISLLYSAITSNDPNLLHSAHFFGGYSDDVEESSNDLIDIGVLKESGTTYSLSEYGLKLEKYLATEDESFKNLLDVVGGIANSLSGVSDEKIVAMTYAFYPELATQSTIAGKISKVNEKMAVNNIPIKMMSKEEFEKMLISKNLLSVE